MDYRFVYNNFESFLSFRKKNTKCPLHDMNLSIEDIFPDNFTKREIDNMRKSYPDQFDPPNPIFECRFSTIACDFKSADLQEVEAHMNNGYKEHIDLLLSSYLKTQYQAWDVAEKSPSDDKEAFFRQQSSTRDLLNAMYERIVVLEQSNREQTAKIEKLQQMAKNRNGILVWRIEDFRKKVEVMQANPQTMFYSPECFTDPNGYKFCARMNLSPKVKDQLSVHIHLMSSENDYHLSWPFVGIMNISMINKDPELTQRDKLISNPEIQAFHRPSENISPRGFGFMEYISIAKLPGFVIDDCLTIKVEMNII